MIFRFLGIIFFAGIIGIKSLFGVDQQQTDSLLRILKNDLVKNDSDKYKILCRVIENSADANIILNYSEEAISLANKMDISPARPTVSRGAGYLQTGKLALALECFLRAADFYKTDKNVIGLATAYTYISAAYISQQNYTNAKYYLKNAIELFNREKDSIRLASALHNLGYEYYRIQQYDSALVLFLKTSEIYQKLGHVENYAYCIGNIGLVYSKQLSIDKAEINLLKAIKILNNYGDELAVTEFMIEYANVLLRKGEIRKAKEYSNKSYRIAGKNNSNELKRDAAHSLAQFYRLTRNYDSAYFYLSLSISYNDSIKNYENIQKMADLRTQFEVSQKQSEVDILEKEKTIQLIIICGLTLILLLAGGFIYVYYSSLKRVRKFTAILDERHKLLEKQSAELKQLNQIKDRFFSIISHDLRGPISSLGGITTLIKESIENNNQDLLLEVSDYIDQTIISVTSLLENLLNWALSQRGQLMFKEERIDSELLIDEVVKIFSSVANSKEISVNLQLHGNLYILGDSNSLMVILRNLVSNALKFTNKGGNVDIITSTNYKGLAEITINDNGIGISKDKLSSLFELKDDKSTRGTEKEKGIGLGLTLVHEFVALNKGFIKVESELGKGTRFILHFPASE